MIGTKLKWIIVLIALKFSLYSQDANNPCLQAQDFHIVVIGSSTAAGSGPSTSDSAWVNRYRKYLQQINPNNQVTNLAIGGTTTYHIMPSWYVAPSGRPAHNSNNVTQAIALGADAVIVNMPSNDASNNFGLTEQMHNFITIANSADSAGVKVWVCTTQPKNYSNQAQIQIQLDVRDSINSHFGTKAIDFWTTIANPSNTIDSLYDSGDGTHLNDAAHRILMNRVKDKNLLTAIYDTLGHTDFAIGKFYIENPSACGDSSTIIKSIVTNMGLSTLDTVLVNLDVLDVSSQTTTTQSVSLVTGTSCLSDTAKFIIPTHAGGEWKLLSYLTPSDTVARNDTSSTIVYKTEGLPMLLSVFTPDSICAGDTVQVDISTQNTDTVFWYKNGVEIGQGSSVDIATTDGLDTLSLKMVKGPLVFQNSLFTTGQSTTNFNGIMFNLLPSDTLHIDSLSIKLYDAGDHGVVAYYRQGSYNAFVTDPTAWTYWGKDSIYNGLSGSFYNLDFGAKTINTGDTIGVYLHIEDGSGRLSYQNNGSATKKNNSELEFISGSGVSHTFGTEYNPRYWNGEVFYHFGYNPDGLCHQETEYVLKSNKPYIDLGPSITISAGDSITFDGGGSFASWNWTWIYQIQNTIHGQTSGRYFTLTDQGPFVMNGNYTLIVEAIDSLGCIATDSVHIVFAPDFSLDENSIGFTIYPNPANSGFYFNSHQSGELVIENVSGKLLHQVEVNAEERFFDFKLKPGIYFLSFIHGIDRHQRKLIVN